MITLDQFIVNERGKKHLIPGQKEEYRGQCVQLIGFYLPDCYNETLPIHANARDYWTYGIPGWVKQSSPQKGDIAVYNGHGDFPEGHIAIVVNGTQVFEENADPDGSPAHIANRANTYLLGYLRNQGGIMPADQVYAELYKRDVRMDQLQADISHLLEVCDSLNVNMDKLIKPGGRLDTDYANLYNAIQELKK